MHISPISFRAAQNPPVKAKKEESLSEMLKKEGVELPKLTPFQTGLINAVGWFSICFLFDRLFGKIFKSFKTPLKFSLAINGGFGLVSGAMAYVKAKKASVENNKKSGN